MNLLEKPVRPASSSGDSTETSPQAVSTESKIFDLVEDRSEHLGIPALLISMLLLLSISWPAPIVWLNETLFGLPLGIHDRSFLGREPLVWDAVYFSIAILAAFGMVRGRDWHTGLRVLERDARDAPRQLLRAVARVGRSHALPVTVALVTVAAVWLRLDQRTAIWIASLPLDSWRPLFGIFNRLSGGANPVLITLFFLLLRVAYRRADLRGIGLSMAVAGLAGGIITQAIKALVSRSRPELMMGAWSFGSSDGSFPSGHTLSAFAIAGVLLFTSRSAALRTTVMLLAVAVALSRVATLRHWPSDVLASIFLGLALSWIAVGALASPRGTRRC